MFLFLPLPDTLFPSAKIVCWCTELSDIPNLELILGERKFIKNDKNLANSRLEELCFK